MLLGELDLDSAPAIKSLDKVDGKFAETTGGMATLGAGASGALAALAVVAGILVGAMAGLKDVLDLGGTLNDLSARTGESVGSLVILREAFSEAGLGAEGVEPFLLKLQNALGGVNEEGEKTTAAFDALGVSAEELRNLDAVGQIEALQKGFAGIADQSTKVQVARNLFGKQGGNALSLLGDASVLDDARQRAGPLAEIMEKNVGAFDKLGDVVGSLKLDFQEFFAGALSEIAPEATSIADALSRIDFVGIGEGVGKLANIVLQLGEAFIAIAPSINFVSELISGVFGSGSKASAGLAEKYRGFAKQAEQENAGKDSTPVSALAKIGLGGLVGGAGDPILSENRRQTQLLQTIADRVRSGPYTPTALDAVPV